MDLNVLMLSGRLAVAPEIRLHDSGAVCARLLIATRRESPTRRVDVLPVSCWDPADDLLQAGAGRRLWVTGSLQRRFRDSDVGRRSRLEVLADDLTLAPCDSAAGTLARP